MTLKEVKILRAQKLSIAKAKRQLVMERLKQLSKNLRISIG